ncbi:MAG: aminomethyl-transferring glycine dehydrogenase subunit GcvPB [Bacteroidales bacterium]
MKLIFERSKAGRSNFELPPLETPLYEPSYKRATELRLPEIAEIDLMRHFIGLSRRAFGIETGFYPLGSCTMKYNPKLNEEVAQLEGYAAIHPLQPLHTVKGCIDVYKDLNRSLCEVTGMDAMSFQPAAGAHGEFTALLMIRAYHHSRNDFERKKVIIPDSAHGTNPASVVMAGFEVVNIPSDENGFVDLEALKAVVGSDTAALMLTNPNTLGAFEKNILEITEIIHQAGGLVYYDGANLNAIMGITRPGDMGFDIVHLNLHKTFSTPHGGGGPGAGPIGCKKILIPFLPQTNLNYRENETVKTLSIGKVKAFHGNFLVCLRALCYIMTLGGNGLKNASEMAVLNANYLYKALAEIYSQEYTTPCMHEFVLSANEINKETGVRALDIAKGLLDNGIHPPTIYFPLIVKEAMMFEPTETESKDTLDNAIEVIKDLFAQAKENPDNLFDLPKTTPIGRVDEVLAARSPKLKYEF